MIGSGLRKECDGTVCCHHVCLIYADYIMSNAWLDELQAEIQVAGRNINNLKYANHTTLMAENEEELKNLLMGVKEESEKAILKLLKTKQKKLTSWHLFPLLHGKQKGEKLEAGTDFLFLSPKTTANGN